MAAKAFKRTFPGMPVVASGVMLRSYSGQLAQVEGQAQVSVRLDDMEATLPLYLTKGPSPTLLGRNWIQALGVRLPEYQEAVRVVEDVPSLLTKFKALLQPGKEMDNLFRGMRHVAVYLDDILVTGLAPAPRKVEAVLKAPKPQNKNELQSYLGLINFYRTFLPNLSSHLQPLHLLLRDGEQWAWRKEQDLAFQRSKELITKAPVLVHFDPAKPVVQTVDASPVVIPQSLRSRVLQLLHAGHPGVEKTNMVAWSHVWWPGLDQDIARMVLSCQICQENQRASRHVEITPWPFPEKPWSRLHVDFGGPFKNHYFLVVVDAFSKWLESGAPAFATRNFRPGPPWSAGHVVSPASASSLLVRMSNGTTWHRHADHVRPRLATSAATPSGSQQAGEPSAVTDASTAPGAAAIRTTVMPPANPGTPARRADSATATKAAPDAATHATPTLRWSARHRRPPDRYSPG
ncbi:hypothetical protein MRX96_015479 [Rhipicephalus microplus]